ncbi:MAG: universal stress protein [Microbacterium sp.]|uniref:universal stress protein n=1 Tax=Microbacterium sp. TaxID=51671 RepID=UPI003F7FE568
MGEAIVVGITDAAASRRAVDWAAQRAAERRQPLELLAVVGGATGAVGEGPIVEAALAEARVRAEVEASRIAGGLDVRTRVERGNPVTRLVEASEGAALLVIGSDYRGPGTKASRGAHGLRIAAGAHSPVVVVPDFDVAGRSGVVVGVDGSPAGEKAVAFAAAEADRLREPLVAVSVWTPLEVPRNMGVYPAEYLENLAHLTEESQAISLAGLRSQYPDLEIVPTVERGYPSQIINELAAKARLAVVGSHGRGALARFLLGSISQEVLAHLGTVTAVVR